MIRSMTGYGKGDAGSGATRIIAEVKGVNHRYGEIYIKLPRPLQQFEQGIKRLVASRLKRGKIEVYVQMEQGGTAGAAPRVNTELARHYRDRFIALRDELGVAGDVSLSLILAQKDVITLQDAPEEDGELESLLAEAVEAALLRHEEMREREGEALGADLEERGRTLEALMASVRERAPYVVEEMLRKLKERVAKLLADREPDDQRLMQEIALLADKSDVTEEVVRFASHLTQYRESLTSPEPVGRKLDFIIQEMNREVNTIGSKANDSEMTNLVVQLKTELEKVREQVQNIE